SCGPTPGGDSVLNDRAPVRHIDDEFALRAGERCDQVRRIAPELELLAQGAVPRLIDAVAESDVRPKSSSSIGCSVVRPRSSGFTPAKISAITGWRSVEYGESCATKPGLPPQAPSSHPAMYSFWTSKPKTGDPEIVVTPQSIDTPAGTNGMRN